MMRACPHCAMLFQTADGVVPYHWSTDSNKGKCPGSGQQVQARQEEEETCSSET